MATAAKLVQLIPIFLAYLVVAIAMVTKVQKMLNLIQTSQSFAVMFPVTSTSSGTK
jgi:hypothetical protein